jgi:hypothetical protein
LKDSLYSAIGLAAASLEQHLNFNEFLQGTMVTEVQIQDQQYRLLRRRFALVLGQWIPVKYGELNTDAIFQIFQHLLNKDDPLNDLVVRITAGRQLSHVLDPYEFTAAHFMPFAQSILGNLMSLVQEVELSETKMGLLETVRVAVVKMEHNVSSIRAIFGSGIDLITDCSIRRSNPITASTLVGGIWRRTSHEAGHSHASLVFDQLVEAGVRPIPLAYSPTDPKLSASRIREFSYQTFVNMHICS